MSRTAPAASHLPDLELLAIDGRLVPLRQHAGQVLLVVNTASRCGFTPQFEGLERLWQDFAGQGLVVLGFPCNQFGAQDPGSEADIASFCQLNYGVSFPMMAKVAVNGDDAHPLWQWLKREKKGLLGTEAVKWNFTKFLIGRDGRVRARFAPNDAPESLRGAIQQALAEPPAVA